MQVPSDRWKRFIVSVLRTRGGVLQPDHDTARGTAVIATGLFGAPRMGYQSYAVCRVQQMQENEKEIHSCCINKPGEKRTFKCELLEPTGDRTPAGPPKPSP